MQLQCLNRKTWVAATPEELVRQTWLAHLQERGFPLSLISVEKELGAVSAPLRRTDILCYGKGNEGLYPLLLIECKAVRLTKKAQNQAIGYNHFIKAPFLAVANAQEIQLGWRGAEGYQFVNHLPSYEELTKAFAP